MRLACPKPARFFPHPFNAKGGKFVLFSFRRISDVLFSFRRKKREPEKKAGNPPGLVRRARPSAERTFPAKIFLRGFSERKAPQGKMGNASRGGRPIDGKRTLRGGLPESFRANPSPLGFLFWGGLPDGFRSSPSPIGFLFFGSFFSFPERKERTEKQPSGSKAASPAGGGGRCAGTISAAAPSCCRAR